MVCVLKENKLKNIYRRKILGRTELKKKNQIAKKVEKVILVSAGEKIKRPLGWRKKKTETNEDVVDKQMKKKIVGKIEKVR